MFPCYTFPQAFLATAPAPRAGFRLHSTLRSWRKQGADVVLCLLLDTEIDMLELQDEAELCARCNMEFIHFPIPDFGVPPSIVEAAELAANLHRQLHTGRSVVTHCFAGIGRSSLMAACILLHENLSPDACWERIARARGTEVPDSDAQKLWLRNHRFRLRPPESP